MHRSPRTPSGRDWSKLSVGRSPKPGGPPLVESEKSQPCDMPRCWLMHFCPSLNAEDFREEATLLLESLPKSSSARLRLEIELLAARALPIEQAASAALCSFESEDVVQIGVGLTEVLEQAEQLLKRANARFESAANTVVRSSSEEQRARLSEFGGISESVRTRSALLAGWARTFRVLLGVSAAPAQDRDGGLGIFCLGSGG